MPGGAGAARLCLLAIALQPLRPLAVREPGWMRSKCRGAGGPRRVGEVAWDQVGTGTGTGSLRSPLLPEACAPPSPALQPGFVSTPRVSGGGGDRGTGSSRCRRPPSFLLPSSVFRSLRRSGRSVLRVAALRSAASIPSATAEQRPEHPERPGHRAPVPRAGGVEAGCPGRRRER